MKLLPFIALLLLAACKDDNIARYQETGDKILTYSERLEHVYSECNRELDSAYPNNIDTLKNGAICSEIIADVTRP